MTTLREFAQFTATFIRYYACAIGPAAILCHATANAMGAEVSARSWVAEKDAAVLLARKGSTAAALVVLERLRREHPADLGVARDLVVVSTWAGRDAEAVRLFVALKQGPQPDYVIEAVALAYRHLGQPPAALAIYRDGLNRSPNNVAFAAGGIGSMADLGETAQAIVLADADLKTHGERRDVLLAAGYAASAQKNPVEALRYIDRAVTLDPSGREPRHDRIMAIDEMGAPQIARRLADENPGVLTDAELRQIDGDAAAALVRWGVFEPPSEELRFAASDRAIRALDGLIARWSRAGDDARHDLLRARFVRMVALRDRVRMADVAAEYVDLDRQGVDIPGYALVAAADAYLYLHQPETARDLYLRGLAVDPRNPETRNRRRMWGVTIEYCLSLIWAWALVMTFVLWSVGKFVAMPEGLNVPTIQPPAFWGLILATTCLIQFVVALVIDQRYEKNIFRLIFWYPFFFWILTLCTSLVGFPKALLRLHRKRAIWVSPDRGIS